MNPIATKSKMINIVENRNNLNWESDIINNSKCFRLKR